MDRQTVLEDRLHAGETLWTVLEDRLHAGETLWTGLQPLGL